jgi:hypothetical protein
MSLRRVRRVCLAASLFVVSTSLAVAGAGAGDALAQSDEDRAQARDLGQQGYAALEAHDYAKAEQLFRHADALFHAPTLLLGLARAEAAQGKYVEAWEHFHRIVLEGVPADSPQAMHDAVESAKREMAAAEPHRARLTLTVKGPASPTVTLDGAALSVAALGLERLVDPGHHVVHAAAAGWQDQDKRFDVPDGGTTQVEVDLVAASPGQVTPNPNPAPNPNPNPNNPNPTPGQDTGHGSSTRRTLAWVGIAAGGAGIVVGAITGALAMGSRSSASSSPCASGPCSAGDLSTYSSDRDSFYTMGTVSTVSFIAGAVLAGAGVVLLVTSPRERPATTGWVAPYVAGTGAGLAGAF